MQPNNLQRIKAKILGKGKKKVTLDTSLWYLIKELKCLPEIIGRDFKVEYDKDGRIVRIRQVPIKLSQLITLFREMEKDYIEQKKEADKMKHKGRRRR